MHQPTGSTFPLQDKSLFKIRMLNWLRRFNIFSLLDNSGYSLPHQHYEYLAAAGCRRLHHFHTLNGLNESVRPGNWYFGHFAYSLAESLYGLTPKADSVGFPPVSFFEPQIVVAIQGEAVIVYAEDADRAWNEINAAGDEPPAFAGSVEVQLHTNREQYLADVRKIQQHILRGDCYELNYCIEFSSDNASADPAALFYRLMEVSPAPFSVLYRLDDSYLICSSPERFLKKDGQALLSQPMKGTAPRNHDNHTADDLAKQNLALNAKERAENVMIVDLVRNDFSQVCEPASVSATDLFAIHSFPQVHQMVSTVRGRLMSNVQPSDVIRATFPMGSMTGAPKKRVVELIYQYERSARGIFSGAVGYFKPNGDFDFNVVIRSIMYNSSRKYLSYQVGSGITFYSVPEKEWEECMLKALGIKKVLTTASTSII